MTWRVVVSDMAGAMLDAINDRRIRQKIAQSIDGLAQEPEKQGKALADELAGYRSLRAVGQRYRVIYKVERDRVIVFIIAVGIRKEGSKRDIYALAQRLIRLGLAEPPEEKQE